MTKDLYRSAMGKIGASPEFKEKTVRALRLKETAPTVARHNRKTLVAAMVPLFLVAGLAGLYLNAQSSLDPVSPGIENLAEGRVDIPRISLPTEPGAAACMVGLVVYQGRIYAQAGTEIDPAFIDSFMGDKIGIATGNIDQWSNQDDYAVELASTVIGEVYTVKGYDSAFRLMITSRYEDEFVAGSIYECLNGISISSGEDLFGKLRMVGRVTGANYVRTYRYSSNHDWFTEIYPFEDISLISRFVEELNNTVPYEKNEVLAEGYLFDNSKDLRYIQISLEDGSIVWLSIRKDGYVLYGYPNVAFKMTSSLFHELWTKLDLANRESIFQVIMQIM